MESNQALIFGARVLRHRAQRKLFRSRKYRAYAAAIMWQNRAQRGLESLLLWACFIGMVATAGVFAVAAVQNLASATGVF